MRVPTPDAVDVTSLPAAHVEDTPDTPTIATLVAALNADHPRADGRDWTAADTLKNVVLRLTALDGTRELVVVGVPGDREVDMKRAEVAFAPATVEAATEEDFVAKIDVSRAFLQLADHVGVAEGIPGPEAHCGVSVRSR